MATVNTCTKRYLLILYGALMDISTDFVVNRHVDASSACEK